MPSLDWIGKAAVVNHHQQVPYRLLQSDPARSVGECGSGNLLVEGDNLLALKALLPYYAGQVKCIYIDPPYNTGNEGWTYNDNVNSPEIRRWLGEVVGREAEDLSRHDKWLCMLYPRLALLKEFLREDGIIFVSVDENEHRHLELLLDELFGAANRIETFIWKKSYGGGSKSKYVVNLHEYIACFAKDIDRIPPFVLPPDQQTLKYYKFKDEKFNTRGPYRLQPLATNSMDDRPNLKFPVYYDGAEIWPEKQWQWSQERVLKAQANNELVFTCKAGRWVVSYKQYLKDEAGEERARKPYSIIEGIYTQQGTNEIKEIFGDGKAFSFPKPGGLIKYLVQMVTDKDDLILDSFAGSGTTGHAVLNLNREDGGSRRFVLIEMDTDTCQNKTAERLHRIITGYGSEAGIGGSFAYCALGDPLFDASGQIWEGVTYRELAQHIFFTETGEPLSEYVQEDAPLIGRMKDTAFYLLWTGRGTACVLDAAALRSLPAHKGLKVVYADGCRLTPERLRRECVIFRQIPYEVKTR